MVNSIFDGVGIFIWVTVLMTPMVFLTIYGIYEVLAWRPAKGRAVSSAPYVFPAAPEMHGEVPIITPRPPEGRKAA